MQAHGGWRAQGRPRQPLQAPIAGAQAVSRDMHLCLPTFIVPAVICTSIFCVPPFFVLQVLLEEVQAHIRQAGMESIADVKVRESSVCRDDTERPNDLTLL